MIKQPIFIAVFLFTVFGNACVLGMNRQLTTWQPTPPGGIVPAGKCSVLPKSFDPNVPDWGPHVRDTNPKVAMLPCGHPFRTKVIAGIVGSDRTFRCPTCRDASCKPNGNIFEMLEISAALERADLEAGWPRDPAQLKAALRRRHLLRAGLIPRLWNLALYSGENPEVIVVLVRERADSSKDLLKVWSAALACGAAGGAIAGAYLPPHVPAVLGGVLYGTGSIGLAMMGITGAGYLSSACCSGDDGDSDDVPLESIEIV